MGARSPRLSRMDRMTAGKILMTFVLGLGAGLGFWLDWSPNHLLNPLWHPHARFHGELLLFFLAGVSAVGIWLVWRASTEPEVAMRAAAALAGSFWTPFFYATAWLPGASLWAGIPGHEPRVAGYAVYPNVLTAGVFLILTGLALWLARRREIAD
jgi:hypothetical protein